MVRVDNGIFWNVSNQKRGDAIVATFRVDNITGPSVASFFWEVQ